MAAGRPEGRRSRGPESARDAGHAPSVMTVSSMMGKIGAVMVPLPGASVDRAAVVARAGASKLKVPQYIAVRSAPLPRNPNGKVLGWDCGTAISARRWFSGSLLAGRRGGVPMAALAMAKTRNAATVLLAKLGMARTVRRYPHDARRGTFGVEAAEAMGVAAWRVFETLIAEVDGKLAAMLPVDRQLDLKALAAAVGSKRARMAEMAAAERATGYVAGGSRRSGSASGYRS